MQAKGVDPLRLAGERAPDDAAATGAPGRESEPATATKSEADTKG
jgi:hypothetical protein